MAKKVSEDLGFRIADCEFKISELQSTIYKQPSDKSSVNCNESFSLGNRLGTGW